MSSKPRNSTDPDILASAAALRRSARRALELGLRTGTPVWVLKRGQIVDLTQEPRRGSTGKAEGDRVYKGVIHGMVVELEPRAILPEGTQVDVVVRETRVEELAPSGHPEGSPQAMLAAQSLPSQCTAGDVDALVDAIQQGKRPVPG